MSRPPIDMTDDMLSKVETFAGQGLTMNQIALVLGIHVSSVYKLKRTKKKFDNAIKKGRSKGIATIANALFESAKRGNVTAMIFFLKNRSPEEWKDRLPEAPPEDLPAPQKVEVRRIDGRRAANE